MQKIILFTLPLILFSITGIKAQNNLSFHQVNIPTTEKIYDVSFIDSLRGIALGDSTIFQTIDAGENWTIKFNVPHMAHFSKLNFNAHSNTFLCDGMSNWNGPTRVSFAFNSTSYSLVHLANVSSHVVVWNPVLLNDSLWSLTSNGVIAAKNGQYRVVSANNNSTLDIQNKNITILNNNKILASSDSSKTWDTIAYPPGVTNASQGYFNGKNTLYLITSYGSVPNSQDHVSFDKGLTWLPLNPNGQEAPTKFHFVEGDTLVAGIKNYSGNVYFSNDGGFNFSKTVISTTSRFLGFKKHSTNVYFAFGFDGEIYKIDLNPTAVGLSSFIDSKKHHHLFPNPTTGMVYLEPTEEVKIKRLQLFNSVGTLVRELKPTQKTINLSELSEGLYYLKSYSEQSNTVQQIILQ